MCLHCLVRGGGGGTQSLGPLPFGRPPQKKNFRKMLASGSGSIYIFLQIKGPQTFLQASLDKRELEIRFNSEYFFRPQFFTIFLNI